MPSFLVSHTTAAKLGKTPAQIALQWGLQMGHSVLPKNTNTMRIRENIDLFDWSIPEDLLANFNEFQQARHFMQSYCHFWIPESFFIYLSYSILIAKQV